MSYPEITSPEMEIAEGGVILDNRARFADLKAMLDSNKDNLKVDAMKRIITLIAKGKDVSELFPAVVKNVAAKNIELRKLVFVYLVRYAEEQQDLALLSISTFQRALKESNQLIRGSALRVLSSIRVAMIAPIMMLAIKDAVRDMSPYVRKVAAHAIPKLHALDENLEPELIECIDFLLADRRSLVLGSAVYAFEQICPNRLDLLHKHYRALCRALIDVDEWGQVLMIQLLTRYARHEFAQPTDQSIDSDLALLLNAARPLLQSRNCSVVMAVTQLFYHVAPRAQLSQVARALVRLLRGPREVQYVVLLNIATMCERNPVEGTLAISKTMFDSFLKSFFVRSSDPVFVKELKLHVLTSLVSEANVHMVLRELQTYVSMSDLAGAAVEAIGRCAVRVGTVQEQCLKGLVQLISSHNETVVCAAVVVLKRLLHAEAPYNLLARLIRLMPQIETPQARACIVWLVATHVDVVIEMAPDFLRILAKSYPNEEQSVKIETLKLAIKLWMVRRERCEKLVQYVLQMAKFDLSYDVRDRCRFMRNLLFNTTTLSKRAEDIFLAQKPAPELVSKFKERDQFQLGTLSHTLCQRCDRYADLPNWPEVSSDAALRRDPNAVEAPAWEESLEEEDTTEDDEEESEEDEESAEENEEEEEENESEEEDDEEEESSGSEEESSEEEAEREEETIQKPTVRQKAATNQSKVQLKQPEKKVAVHSEKNVANSGNLDLLIDLDLSSVGSRPVAEAARSTFSPLVLLNTVESDGLEVKLIEFTRENDGKFTPFVLAVRNTTNRAIKDVTLRVADMRTIINGNKQIELLDANETRKLRLAIDMEASGGATKKVEMKLEREAAPACGLTIEIPLGEQIQPVRLSVDDFEKEWKRLGGMNRHKGILSRELEASDLIGKVNVAKITDKSFAGQTRSQTELVLIRLDDVNLEVTSENAIFSRMLHAAIVKI